MPNLRLFIFMLFFPAGLGLSIQLLQVKTHAERLLALSLLIFCLELAHMAWVDFKTIQTVSQASEDSRLKLFFKVVFSTVVLEVFGFYGALVSLRWGGIVVIASQLWFNLLAKVQLWPGKTPAVEAFGISQRLPVLVANSLSVVLLLFWAIPENRIWLSMALLILIISFLFIKYIVLRDQSSIGQTDQADCE
ncbi:MAG: hypothetical protein AAFQ63_13515 [Cyanobacteria bacterium J06621_11]